MSVAGKTKYSFHSEIEDLKTALDNCSKHGTACQLWMWFNQECGALAADGDKVGWGTSSVFV